MHDIVFHDRQACFEIRRPKSLGIYRQPKIADICMKHHPEGASYDNNSICSLSKTQPHQLYRLLMTLLRFICV